MHVLEQLARRGDVLRRNPHLAVRRDVVVAEAVIDRGLEDLDRCRAIWARRSRRMSSSLLPLNMLPVTTSIQPELRRW
jgi:hypothetical protein